MKRAAPQRTCVACRTTRPKRELVRVVRAPTGALAVDLRGKAPGRGAYLCPDEACLERGLRDGALGRALEMAIDGGAQETLRHALANAARERKKTMAGGAPRGAGGATSGETVTRGRSS